MLSEGHFYRLIGPAIAVVFVASLILRFRLRKISDPLEKMVLNLRGSMVLFGAFLLLLAFALPSTPSFSTFFYPQTPSDIQDPKRVLELLQMYNKSIARIADVLYMFIFVFVFWFLSLFLAASKALTKKGQA